MELKLAVCGILFENDKVLTVSRKDNHELIGLPGGKVDDGENIIDALIRETLEETGFHVKIDPIYPFIDRIDEFLVYCYLMEKSSDEQEEISPEETGKVEFVEINRLLTSSPFIEYNKKAFEYFCFKVEE